MGKSRLGGVERSPDFYVSGVPTWGRLNARFTRQRSKCWGSVKEREGGDELLRPARRDCGVSTIEVGGQTKDDGWGR